MAEFVLYGCWRSSASDRLQIGLRCKALSFRYVPVDLDQSEQTSDSYLAINPRGEVPTLIVDGQAWFQTLSILVELEGRYPDQGFALLPAAPDDSPDRCVWCRAPGSGTGPTFRRGC